MSNFTEVDTLISINNHHKKSLPQASQYFHYFIPRVCPFCAGGGEQHGRPGLLRERGVQRAPGAAGQPDQVRGGDPGAARG